MRESCTFDIECKPWMDRSLVRGWIPWQIRGGKQHPKPAVLARLRPTTVALKPHRQKQSCHVSGKDSKWEGGQAQYKTQGCSKNGRPVQEVIEWTENAQRSMDAFRSYIEWLEGCPEHVTCEPQLI